MGYWTVSGVIHHHSFCVLNVFSSVQNYILPLHNISRNTIKFSPEGCWQPAGTRGRVSVTWKFRLIGFECAPYRLPDGSRWHWHT